MFISFGGFFFVSFLSLYTQFISILFPFFPFSVLLFSFSCLFFPVSLSFYLSSLSFYFSSISKMIVFSSIESQKILCLNTLENTLSIIIWTPLVIVNAGQVNE